MSNSSGFDAADARALRRPARRLRRQRPAGPDRRDRRRDRQGGARRARSPPSAYRHGAKFVDVDLLRRARQARAPRARRSDDTLEFVPVVVRRADARARRAALRAHRAQRPDRARPARRHRPRRAGRDSLPFLQRDRQGRQRAHDQLEHRSLPEPAVGAAVHPDLDDDAALAKLVERDRPRLPARRATTRSPPGSERADALVGVGRAADRSAASTRCTSRARAPT